MLSSSESEPNLLGFSSLLSPTLKAKSKELISQRTIDGYQVTKKSNLNLKRSLENRTLQPNLSLAIEKPDHVKVEISPDESDESLEFPEDIENTSNHSKKENIDNPKQEKMDSDTGRNELIQEKRKLKSGLKIECKNLQKPNEEEIERNDQEENNNRENEEKLSENENENEIDPEISTTYVYESKKIDITFWEYITSFVKKSDLLKEKMTVLNKGMKNIEERLDIFNIMKKFREIDKLKALLLEDDQLILFNGLPKPEVKSEDDLLTVYNVTKVLKDSKFVDWEGKQEQIEASYKKLKEKPKKSKVDSKLLAIYKSTFDTKHV